MTPAAPSSAPLPATAIVLAAGRSSRMQRAPAAAGPKALADLGGEPALGRILRVLREVPVLRIVLVLRKEHADVARAVDLAGVSTAVNLGADAGQTSSIRIGVQNIGRRPEGFLLCPVDVPLFTAADVRALYAARREAPAGTSIVVPSHGGKRGHPAWFDRSLAGEFLELPDAAPAHEVVRRDPARVLHVASDNPWLVADLDTPEELAAARAWLTETR